MNHNNITGARGWRPIIGSAYQAKHCRVRSGGWYSDAMPEPDQDSALLQRGLLKHAAIIKHQHAMRLAAEQAAREKAEKAAKAAQDAEKTDQGEKAAAQPTFGWLDGAAFCVFIGMLGFMLWLGGQMGLM